MLDGAVLTDRGGSLMVVIVANTAGASATVDDDDDDGDASADDPTGRRVDAVTALANDCAATGADDDGGSRSLRTRSRSLVLCTASARSTSSSVLCC